MTTPASRVTELLPCPFCGGRGIPGTTLDNAGYVMCASETCWCMTGYLPTEAEAIAAWNTRSLSSDSVSDGSNPLTETQIWALSRIDDQFAILGPATGDGQRMTEAERNDLIERKLVAQVPLELLEGLSQPNGHWTPEYMSEIRKKHGADTTALLRPSSAASLECIHSYYRSALDSGTGGQQPVAWLSWIVIATDAPKLVFAHPETEGAFPVYAPTEPKAGVVSEP